MRLDPTVSLVLIGNFADLFVTCLVLVLVFVVGGKCAISVSAVVYSACASIGKPVLFVREMPRTLLQGVFDLRQAYIIRAS